MNTQGIIKYEDILNEDLFEPIDRVIFEKTSELVNATALLNLINSARDEFHTVSKSLILAILVCKKAYRRLDSLHKQADMEYHNLRATRETTYLMKDETNPFYKVVNGPTTFAQAEARRDDGVVALQARAEELNVKKSEVWDLKESLEDALEVCKIIFQNPDRVPPSGEVVDVDEQLRQLRENLDD